ncbi:MAG: hypothetical protein PHD01_17800, partial [Geobacteraceae bacterium]|nr:hypothetical protein [Geobacteraceae bacterium]
MKKIAFRLSALLGIILLMAIVAAGWLLGSTEGARFILDTAAKNAGARLNLGKLDGRLLDELHLEKATIATPLLSVKIEFLRVQWNPGMLLTGNIALQSLDLQGVVIQDNRPKKEEPLDLSWPTLSGTVIHVNGWISHLALYNLSYRRNASEPVIVSEMTGRVDWHSGQAALTRMFLRTPTGTVTGDAGISFRKPLLNIFATVTPKEPVAGFSRLLVQAELAPGKGADQASGRIRAVAASI